ncbi:MAG: aminopeptidase P family protein [Gemmatimonadetes bacterium]|nr:aminopeptidase P family protein [Gemmatimonadota bacterium]
MKALALWFVAAPLAAQSLPPAREPVAELPGAGRPVNLAATTARRDALFSRLPPGIVIVPSAGSRDLETDVLQDSDFRQDDDFFYLTGLETPEAVLLLTRPADAPQRTVLFLPPRDPAQEAWTGLRLGPGPEASRLSGIPTVLSTEALDSVRAVELALASGPIYTVARGPASDSAVAATWARQGRRDLVNLAPVLDSMRLVKDADEIARLRRAIEITVEAQLAAMRAMKPGMKEYQIEATVEYVFRDRGADRVGFPSIIGSGPNSTTLHYDVNRRTIEDGDLVVMDIGAEYGQYTADVTRTVPANGRFTPRQRAIYELVLATQQAALEAVKPGVTVGELNGIARRYLREHSGDLCRPRTCDAFFVHGLSHWLGMRVHDVGDYRMPLQAGMVLTIEPGIYLSAERLGVRIEDDVLVTLTGYELLSGGAPRSAADVEHTMKHGATDAIR